MPEHPRTPAEVVAFQAEACGVVGSLLYQQILTGVLADMEAGGVCHRLLADRVEDPFGSALALRFLGAVHRLVLEGQAPALAALYPSTGGDPAAGDVVAAFLSTVEAHEGSVDRRMADGVQTNEVGRAAALVGGYAEVLRQTGLPLRVLEVGTSAGLNLRFDRFAYDTGDHVAGDPASPVRFTGVWDGPPPPLPPTFAVAERRGCDRHPLDATTEDGRLALLSYVWPDQPDRIARLEAAITVARSLPVQLEQADAATWVERQLATPVAGVATVVVHSIVIQYLAPERRRQLRAAIADAGQRATEDAPVAWLRMEPAGPVAEVRLSLWPGGEDRQLATAGYHGVPVTWLA